MSLLIVTKTYAPDHSLCETLNRSILRYADRAIEHQIIVPNSDLPLFQALNGPRTRVVCDAEFLPAHFVPLIRNFTLNLHRPWPPLRGWMQQQIVKLAAIAAAREDAVLTVDSDVEFIRPFSSELFVKDGLVRFYRDPGTIDGRLPRQVGWHKIAREMLAIPQRGPPFADYIRSPIPWNPRLVRAMLGRVEEVSGKPWQTAISRRLDFSECVLYGVYVDEIAATAHSFPSDDPLCASYWEHRPLTEDGVSSFLRTVRDSDIAVMISSKSGTTPQVRDHVLERLRAGAGAAAGILSR